METNSVNPGPEPSLDPADDARSLRALRGATTVDRDAPPELLDATRELLRAMLARNDLDVADLVSIIFTTTRDLSSADPARAARNLGWDHVPLLCMSEIAVPSGLARCVRVLMHVEMPRARGRLRPVYLRDATALRPDLAARA